MALVVIPVELVAELPVAAELVITVMVLKVLVKLQAVPIAEPLEKEDPELLLMVATAEAVAAAGTAVAELALTVLETMTVEAVEVLVLFGPNQTRLSYLMNTYYHLVNIYLKHLLKLETLASQHQKVAMKQVILVMDSLKYLSHYHMIMILSLVIMLL